MKDMVSQMHINFMHSHSTANNSLNFGLPQSQVHDKFNEAKRLGWADAANARSAEEAVHCPGRGLLRASWERVKQLRCVGATWYPWADSIVAAAHPDRVQKPGESHAHTPLLARWLEEECKDMVVT